MDLIIIRIAFIVVVAIACYHLKPFGLANLPGWEAAWASAGAGVFIGLLVVWFEARLRVVSLKRLIGAVIGSIFGILGATSSALSSRTPSPTLKRSVSSC